MRKRAVAIVGLTIVLAVVVAVVAVGGPPLRAQQSPASAAAPLAAQRAFLDQYCVACHSVKARVAGVEAARKLTLDDKDLGQVAVNGNVWEPVIRKVRAGMMPPVSSGAKKPEPAALEAMMVWLENELDRSAEVFAPPPGLHRLNRAEYSNVIRDLLGLEIDSARFLPSDDSTHGFDNMAGTLGISSTLVEAYISAAGKISRLAMGSATESRQEIYRVPEDTSQDYHVDDLPLGTRGGMLINHEFPADGEYTIDVITMFGDNMSQTAFGTVPCEKLEVLLDGVRLQLMDWTGNRRGGPPAQCSAAGGSARGQRGGQRGGQQNQARGAVDGAMQVTFKTTAGRHAVGVTFPATNLAPILDINQHFLRDTIQTGPTPGFTFFPHIGTVRIDGPHNATPATDSPSRRKIFVCRPSPPASNPADETDCARKIITNLVTRAFRHPATVEEVDTLLETYQSARKEGSFDHGIEMALWSILSDLKFIYRIETEPPDLKTGQSYRIGDMELASRLSFFLWSASPDDQLIRLASQGKLKEPATLEQQTRRMLEDPRASALAANFAGQWLNLRGMQAVGPLPLVYPNFDDPLRQAMRREVELFFDSVVREDRSVVDLLTADYTFVNERLAKHYGIPNIYGSYFRRVNLGPTFDIRRGLLGKAAILTTTSKPDRTNAVVRGNWILLNILGMRPPDQPPVMPPPLPQKADDAAGNTKEPTLRQKMEQHRAVEPCRTCHKIMDPIGLSLENFDGIGKWRTQDEGNPIDASGELVDGSRINGPVELRQALVRYSDQFVRVIAEKMLTYALGRGTEHQDMPLVRSIARDAALNNNRFSALVLGIVKSKPFQMNTKVGEE